MYQRFPDIVPLFTIVLCALISSSTCIPWTKTGNSFFGVKMSGKSKTKLNFSDGDKYALK